MKIKTDAILSKLGRINDEEFKVLFFILNTINMNSGNEHSVKIYRAMLADLCDKSEKTITRITNRLVEKGLIVKDNVSDGSKLYNYYSIPCQEKSQTWTPVDNKTSKLGHRWSEKSTNLDTGVPVKESKEIKESKENKKEKNTKKKNVEETVVEINEQTSNEEECFETVLAKIKPVLKLFNSDNTLQDLKYHCNVACAMAKSNSRSGEVLKKVFQTIDKTFQANLLRINS